jgi:ASC-1-like (ASCH) protein
MIYTEHLSEPWFTEINEGRKTIEGRKNKGIFANMTIGDIIEWYNDDNEYRSCRSIVTNIRKYNTFKDYLLEEGLSKCLPTIDDIDDGVNVYYQYYTKEDEKKYGVVAIELKLI